MKKGLFYKILTGILAISFILFLITYFLKNNLPDSAQIDNSLLKEPVQEAIEMDSFSKDEKGVKYTISPKYSYELWGLVVSINDNEVWYSRFKQTDPLNTKDVCVIWGENLKNNNYQKFKFKSEEFVCFFSSKKYVNFNQSQLSNNHLLYADNETYKQIRNINIGDQIHLKGYLTNYSGVDKNGQKFTRSSSFSRTDVGDGACETIFVKEADFIKKNRRITSYLCYYSKLISVLIFAVLIITFLLSLRKPKNEDDYIPGRKTKKDLEQVLPPSVTNKF